MKGRKQPTVAAAVRIDLCNDLSRNGINIVLGLRGIIADDAIDGHSCWFIVAAIIIGIAHRQELCGQFMAEERNGNRFNIARSKWYRLAGP